MVTETWAAQLQPDAENVTPVVEVAPEESVDSMEILHSTVVLVFHLHFLEHQLLMAVAVLGDQVTITEPRRQAVAQEMELVLAQQIQVAVAQIVFRQLMLALVEAPAEAGLS